MNFVHIQSKLNVRAFFNARASVNTSDNSVIADTVQVQVHFVTQGSQQLQRVALTIVFGEASRNTGSS